MNALRLLFSDLFNFYSEIYSVITVEGASRSDLMAKIPASIHGVYTFWSSNAKQPFYIGCAGKISRKKSLEKNSAIELSGNKVKSRMFNASTPYHFSKSSNFIQFSPTTAGVPPEGYNSSIAVNDLIIKVICIHDLTAPAALEHLLIQGYINEFGDLPEANQAI